MRKKQVSLSITGLICLFLIIAVTNCSPGAAKLGTEKNPIVMTFVPSGDTQEIITGGDAIAKIIAAKTGLAIKTHVGTDFAAVREAMGSGKAHIGWFNTFNYVLAH